MNTDRSKILIGLIFAASVLSPLAWLAAENAADRPKLPQRRTAYVTSLGDAPRAAKQTPGTFRAVLADADAAYKRDGVCTTIRFKVSGELALADKLFITTPWLIVDGSPTVPNPRGWVGVSFTHYQVGVVNTHDLTLRHLRFRCGEGWATDEEAIKAHGPGGQRSLCIYAGSDVAGAPSPAATSDILVENCSIERSTDDNGCVWGDCRRVKFRNCIFAGNRQTPAKAFLAGADPDKPFPNDPKWLTLDHCLFADFQVRGPDIDGGVCNIVNCVIVSPYQGARLLKARVNIVGNYILAKRNHTWGAGADRPFVVYPEPENRASIVDRDNWLNGRPAGVMTIVGIVNRGQTAPPIEYFWSGIGAKPSAEPADAAFPRVLAEAGCRPLDNYDAGLMANARAEADAWTKANADEASRKSRAD